MQSPAKRPPPLPHTRPACVRDGLCEARSRQLGIGSDVLRHDVPCRCGLLGLGLRNGGRRRLAGVSSRACLTPLGNTLGKSWGPTVFPTLCEAESNQMVGGTPSSDFGYVSMTPLACSPKGNSGPISRRAELPDVPQILNLRPESCTCSPARRPRKLNTSGQKQQTWEQKAEVRKGTTQTIMDIPQRCTFGPEMCSLPRGALPALGCRKT